MNGTIGETPLRKCHGAPGGQSPIGFVQQEFRN